MEGVWVLVAVGAAAAGFVQGLSGFAFGMVAMSFWAWTLPPQVAATLTVFGALTGQVIAAVSARRGFDRWLLLPFVAGGLLGVPLGVMVLPHIDMAGFKAFLGLLLVSWCPAMLMAHRLPRITRGGRWGDGAAGLAGGIMAGLGGFSGTLPTLWCTLRGFDKQRQRAVIQNFNLSMLAVTFAAYAATGLVTRDMVPLFAVVAPAMLVPTLLGNRLYHGLSEARFRQLVLGLLTLSGVALLVSAVPQLVARTWPG